MEAVKAVFRSWDNPRANVYRRMNDIPYSWGTAVNVQSMVFGNLGKISGTGVAFTRDPATGEKNLFGEYLINAQGEDVVAGIRTAAARSPSLQEDMPEVYEQFARASPIRWKSHYQRHAGHGVHHRERKALSCSRPVTAREPPPRRLKIAVDLVDEGMITEEEAVLRVEPKQLDSLLHPQFEAKALKAAKPVGTGPCRHLPALPAVRVVLHG